jgi:Tfp pilus assembly protein PilO
LLLAFWFLVLSPKRDEAATLGEEVATLEASVAEQEQAAASAEMAKADYADNYHRLVVLGKAVPGDDDSASLISQTQTLAERAGIDFRSIIIADSVDAEVAAPAPAAAESTVDAPPSGVEGATAVPATTAPATETAAATLPIGSTVGPAGLPVMPYDLTFRGDFFDIADFMAKLDGLVRTDGGGVGVNGRLLTVDGFTFHSDTKKRFPFLGADLHVTSFVAPADQGLTAGATETAPATGVPATATPAPTTTATPTSSGTQ